MVTGAKPESIFAHFLKDVEPLVYYDTDASCEQERGGAPPAAIPYLISGMT